MKRANVLGAALVVAGVFATAAPAAAQATIGADAGLFSSYVWRGIDYTNKFVIQPDVYLTFPTGPASFTAGGWFNIEAGAGAMQRDAGVPAVAVYVVEAVVILVVLLADAAARRTVRARVAV